MIVMIMNLNNSLQQMQANIELRLGMSSSLVYFYIVKHKTSKTSRILNNSTISSSENLQINPKKLINSQWNKISKKQSKRCSNFIVIST